MPYFQYGQVEIDYLKRCDSKLGAAIESIGMINRPVSTDLFSTLVRSIVNQLISTKAANSIWGRLSEKLIEITPQSVASSNVADIKECGLSMRKAEYIKGIDEAVISGKLDLSALHEMSDDEVRKVLMSFKGIGPWTVEMILIFSLCRQDIVSWKDVGIQRGMMKLYGLKELTKEQFDIYCVKGTHRMVRLHLFICGHCR